MSRLTRELVGVYETRVEDVWDQALAYNAEMTVHEFGLYFREGVVRDLMMISEQTVPLTVTELYSSYGEVEMERALTFLAYDRDVEFVESQGVEALYDVLYEGLLAMYVLTNFYIDGVQDGNARLADCSSADLLYDVRGIQVVDLNALEDQ